MLLLIGMPGSGKSTLGRLLAKNLHLPFFDTDELLKKELGCSIPEFFKAHGESAFRDKEQEIIARVTQGNACVIATGGGAILREENRIALQSAGCVVYLRAKISSLFKRLKSDVNRPLLQTATPFRTLQALLQERSPLYESCAHIKIDIDNHSIKTLPAIILAQLELNHYIDWVTGQSVPATYANATKTTQKTSQNE